MRVLIVESNAALGGLWQRHIQRFGHEVVLAATQGAASAVLLETGVDIVVLDLVLAEGSPLAVAELASFRQPDAKVIFVTNTRFFSDGSIFQHIRNAAAFLPSSARPDDLAALIDYYGEEKDGSRSGPAER